MNKKSAVAIITVTIGIVLYMLFLIAKVTSPNPIDVDKIAQIALVDLEDNSSSIFQANKEVIILYFNTSCPYCTDVINNIYNNADSFRHAELYFVSSEEREKIAEYSAYFDTNKLNFFSEPTRSLERELRVRFYPTIFIFSKERKFIKSFKGAVMSNL